MGFSVRIAPGVRVRASSRGVRASFGPRAARVHVGGGRAGFSSGAGPLSYYTSIGGSTRRTSATRSGTAPRRTTSRTTATLAQAAKAQEAGRLQEAIDAIFGIHHEEFPPATKPLAPPPPLVDAAAIRDRFAAAAVQGLGLFDRTGRKAAKAKAAAEAEERIQRDVEQLRQQYADYQTELDNWWARLSANDADVVLHQLATAFEDNEAAAAPLGVADGEATLVVLLPGDESLPDRTPTTTAAGNIGVKKTTKRDHDLFYNALAAGYTLVTVKEAFAVAPALRSVRIVAVRGAGTDAYGKKRGEALLAARIRRERLVGVQWSQVDAVTILADVSDELVLNRKGVNKTLMPLDLTREPELLSVIDSVDFDELDD